MEPDWLKTREFQLPDPGEPHEREHAIPGWRPPTAARRRRPIWSDHFDGPKQQGTISSARSLVYFMGAATVGTIAIAAIALAFAGETKSDDKPYRRTSTPE